MNKRKQIAKFDKFVMWFGGIMVGLLSLGWILKAAGYWNYSESFLP